MKKIAIFQSDLHVGGITRSLINLLSELPSDEYDIDLFIFSEGVFFKDKLNENVHLYILPRSSKLYKYLPFYFVEKIYAPEIDLNKEYDIAIDYNSFWHECSIGALKVNAKKRVMWLHSDIIAKEKVEFRYRVVWNLQYRKIKQFDEFVAVSTGVKNSFYKAARGADRKKKVRVINNIVDAKDIIEKSKKYVEQIIDNNKYNIVCVGHLGKEKGIDILIKFFNEAYKIRKDITLYIIGDGPERRSIEKMINDFQISDSVFLLGNIENPFPYEKQMDAFALTSRYEGQGIVLWEAKVLGLQIIMSTNLEKYNDGIIGTANIISAIVNAKKMEKNNDMLEEYNQRIKNSIEELFSNG